MDRILFVDDEPKILQAYQRTLRKEFKIVGAESGHAALQILEQDSNFPVIVSDMQMPKMNGVELLAEVKQRYPDMVRIMLTGNADQATAVEAINTGDVYRFINKPCPAENMIEALNSALQYSRLLQAEKVLLDETLRGSIAALADILMLTRPEVFGRLNEMKAYMQGCAIKLGVEFDWQMEAVALMSQMGLAALPETLVKQVLEDQPLSEESQRMFEDHPGLGADIIAKIPRLENVAAAIRMQLAAKDPAAKDNQVPLASRMIKPIVDLCFAESSGLGLAEALAKVTNNNCYDAEVITALAEVVEDRNAGDVINLRLNELSPGQTLALPIYTESGALLLEQGQELNDTMIARLENFAKRGEISALISVAVYARNSTEGQGQDAA